MSPRVGLVAYGTKTGLGYQTKAIHDHLHPDKTLLVDLSQIKGMPCHREWYPDATVTAHPRGVASEQEMVRFLDGLDVVFVCETPISYRLFALARARGIRVVLQYNYEFLDYLRDPTLTKPTVFAAPSPWNVHKLDKGRFPHVWPLPVPIDPAEIPQRIITEAKTFLHIGGRPAARDRNGTLDFITLASRCADLGARWVLASQSPTQEIQRSLRGTHVEMVVDIQTLGDMYAAGDVMILPRRYGGFSFPAIEALTAGMPVLMPDIPPNTSWLPAEWLTPAAQTSQFQAKARIDVHTIDMPALESLVRRLWAEPATVQAWSQQARDIASTVTWEALLPLYREFLNRVMELEP